MIQEAMHASLIMAHDSCDTLGGPDTVLQKFMVFA